MTVIVPLSGRAVRRALGTAAAALAALAVTASTVTPATASPAAPAAAAAQAERRVTVMSYNLFLGADLQPLFTATPDTVATLAQGVWDHVEQVDFRVRARAIARQIDATDPAVIGLQEVALWERGATPDTLAPKYDHLQILLRALAARGERYRAVSTSSNFRSPALPLASGGVARFTDRDVILVRAGVWAAGTTVSHPESGRYAVGIPLPNPLLGGATIVRGWASVDVRVRGRSFRFVDTHLEAYSPEVRAAQAAELAARFGTSPLPVVVVGDLNSQPTDSTGAYGILTAGLRLDDAWTAVHGPAGGDTSGQTDDLNLPESRIDHRIDYVLYSARGLRAVASDVVGEAQADRTAPRPGAPYGLWPSDHAGVVATLVLR